MRFPSMLVTTAAALLFAGAVPASASPVAVPAPAPALAAVMSPAVTPNTLALPAPPAAATQEVRIEVDDNGGRAWYTNPVWIAIGVIALILIVLLIAMAGRGRDTTVVK